MVYTRSARCLLAIVRRLSPLSRRKNETRNGIKGWVGEKKVDDVQRLVWGVAIFFFLEGSANFSLTYELYCITKAKLSKRGREKKKKKNVILGSPPPRVSGFAFLPANR